MRQWVDSLAEQRASNAVLSGPAPDIRRELVEGFNALAALCAGVAERRFFERMIRCLSNRSLDLPDLPAAAEALDGAVEPAWRAAFEAWLYRAVVWLPGGAAEAEAFRAHCLATAAASAALVTERPRVAWLAGLLHDIGHLVLMRNVTGSDGTPSPSPAIVTHLSVDLHPALSAVAASAWSLSSAISEAMRYHHHPELASADSRDLVHRVALAAQVANAVAAQRDGARASDHLPVAALQALGSDPVDLLGLAGAVVDRAGRGASVMRIAHIA